MLTFKGLDYRSQRSSPLCGAGAAETRPDRLCMHLAAVVVVHLFRADTYATMPPAFLVVRASLNRHGKKSTVINVKLH